MARTAVTSSFPFTGTNSTPVATADATNWTDQNGNNGQLVLKDSTGGSSGNSFRCDFNNWSDCAYKGAGSFTDDQYFELALVGTWNSTDSDHIGGCLRNNGLTPSSMSMYRVTWSPALNSNSGAAQVRKVVNGAFGAAGTQIGTDVPFTMAANDLLSAEAVANGANVDIIVYKNGVAQGTRSDTSSVLTGGKPGISGKDSANAIFGDNWIAGNVTSGGSLASRRAGLCQGTSSVEIGRASGGLFRKNSWGLLVPAWSM